MDRRKKLVKFKFLMVLLLVSPNVHKYILRHTHFKILNWNTLGNKLAIMENSITKNKVMTAKENDYFNIDKDFNPEILFLRCARERSYCLGAKIR